MHARKHPALMHRSRPVRRYAGRARGPCAQPSPIALAPPRHGPWPPPVPDALVRHVEGAPCPHRHARDSAHGSRVHVSELAGQVLRCSEQSDGAHRAAKGAAEGRGARARRGLFGLNEAKARGPGRRSRIEKIAHAILCTRISRPVSKAARRGVPMGEQAGAVSPFLFKGHGYPSLTSPARMAGRIAQGVMAAQRE